MPESLPHIVIVGAGFGGLSAAQTLAKTQARITIIDKHNYHLFQPLLYQAACAALSPSDIASPIRTLFRRRKNVHVVMDEVIRVETKHKRVIGKKGPIPYDYLILAPGSEDSYFGHDEWARHAQGLKSLADAVTIRQKLLSAFEEAETTDDAAMREWLTTLVLVGAGPTGVEMAGAMAELTQLIMAGDFRRVNPMRARILLIEAGGRVLPGFSEHLSAAALQALQAKGVEVLLNARVEQIDDKGVIANGKRLYSKLVLWTAGVKACPVASWLDIPVETDKSGRIIASDDLGLHGAENVFIVGDAAHVTGKSGAPLPGVAPVAKQQGSYAAKIIQGRIEGFVPATGFTYKDYGSLATVGRYFAIADFGWIRMKGLFAWLLWGVAHIYYLIGFRNRLMVFMNWAWEFTTFRRGSRLIITEEKSEI